MLSGLLRLDESTRGIGRRGERVAARLMKQRRCRVVGRNVRLPHGEIDLLCEHKASGTVVVVEVKARLVRDASDTRRPEDNITAAKKHKLRTLALALMKQEGFQGRAVRIDVVSVRFAPGRRRPVGTEVFEDAL